MSSKKLRLAPLALAITLALAGCAARPPLEHDVQSIDKSRAKQGPAPVSDSADIEAGYANLDGFLITPIQQDAWTMPDTFHRKISKLSVTESSVYDALQLLAEEAGVSLSIDGGARALERYGAVAMYNLSGSVEQVLDKMSRRMGFYWRVMDGMLVVEQEQDYVLDMPPALADDSMSTITNTLQHFGVKDVYLDHQHRTLAFKANQRVAKLAENYIANIRANRNMIIYSINVWQVDLSDAHRKGIDWNAFGLTYATGSVGVTAAKSTAAGLGMVLNKNAVNLDGILSYLETQGTVKTLSQPRIAVLAGSKGKLSVGQTTAYVSKVGSNVSSALSQVTVETQNLQTGMQVQLQGEIHDNTVYTNIHMNLADLIKMNKFTALGTDLNLPQTASREIETLTRARPGDTILLGGITINQDTADNTTSFGTISDAKNSVKSELVIAIRPALVNFKGRAMGQNPDRAQLAAQPPKVESSPVVAEKPLPGFNLVPNPPNPVGVAFDQVMKPSQRASQLPQPAEPVAVKAEPAVAAEPAPAAPAPVRRMRPRVTPPQTPVEGAKPVVAEQPVAAGVRVPVKPVLLPAKPAEPAMARPPVAAVKPTTPVAQDTSSATPPTPPVRPIIKAKPIAKPEIKADAKD